MDIMNFWGGATSLTLRYWQTKLIPWSVIVPTFRVTRICWIRLLFFGSPPCGELFAWFDVGRPPWRRMDEQMLDFVQTLLQFRPNERPSAERALSTMTESQRCKIGCSFCGGEGHRKFYPPRKGITGIPPKGNSGKTSRFKSVDLKGDMLKLLPTQDTIVTTKIIPFLVGNPYRPSFVIVAGVGGRPKGHVS